MTTGAAPPAKRQRTDSNISVPDCCAQPAVDVIQARAPGFTADLGIILGTGMGGVAKTIENKIVIPYSKLPGFPVSTVSGHMGNLVLGQLHGLNVACLQGRVHLYEGIEPNKVLVYIYTLRLLGCQALFLTSAVGSLVKENGPGTCVLLNDHINLQGRNVLVGPNDPIGTRFPSMLDAYDPPFRATLKKCAEKVGIRLPEGVYLAVIGPSFETPAEIRAFRGMGADVVGMSVVSEVTAARHANLRVAAVTLAVNHASGLFGDEHITHEETLHWSDKAGSNMEKLLGAFCEEYRKELED